MKLFVILSRFPYPLDKGDKLRAYYQLESLAKTHEICLVCLTEKNVPESHQVEIRRMVAELHILKIGKLVRYWRAFVGIFRTRPLQVYMFYSARHHRRIRSIIRNFQPEHIFCQLIRVSEYVKKEYDIRKTLDYMDALSTGMLRMSADSSYFRKRIYKLESRRLAKYENLIFDYFDHHTIISNQDRDLIYHPERKRIHIIPNGVNTDKLTPIACEKKYDLVFHGNMSYPPNVTSALYLGTKILPLLDDGTRILISGTTPHPSVLAMRSENITISGWVDDMRQSYCSAHLFVAPMLINTGLQNKILEAMCLGIPCITTTLANNAIGATPGKELIIANTADEFARSIKRLLDDAGLCEEIALNARHFIQEHYSWDHINRKLAGLFDLK